jgi:hypothetical protein
MLPSLTAIIQGWYDSSGLSAKEFVIDRREMGIWNRITHEQSGPDVGTQSGSGSVPSHAVLYE